MSFLGKFRPISYLGNPSAPAVRPSYGRDVRVPPVPLHAPSGAPARAGEGTTGRFSNGLKEFLWQLEGIGRGSLLDLGAVSQATLTYFIEHNFKVYTDDLMAAWGAFLEQDSQRIALLPPDVERPDLSLAARAGRFLASNLRYPADSFDAVLLWDSLDYMDRDAAKQFLLRIVPMIREGGAVLAIFHTRPPAEFNRYRVMDAHTLQLVPSPALVQPQHVYQNREIQELFEKFRTSKTFVGRDQLREGVFVK